MAQDDENSENPIACALAREEADRLKDDFLSKDRTGLLLGAGGLIAGGIGVVTADLPAIALGTGLSITGVIEENDAQNIRAQSIRASNYADGLCSGKPRGR